MSNFRCEYLAVSENCYDPDLGEYHTYGIQINFPIGWEMLHDVSTSKKTVENLVYLFNRDDLSPVHLYDAILDMIP